MNNNWEAILAGNLLRNIPKGYDSTSEVAEKWGISHEAAFRRLRRLKEKGLVDCVDCYYKNRRSKAWKILKK